MGRLPCCDEPGLKKGPWTIEEDNKLKDYIEKHGHGSWRSLPKLAGLNRCGKSCRLRWTNYLRPDIKRGKFSEEEEHRIIELHAAVGNKWSAIATYLQGRTDNEIKNYWNTHIKKKLIRMGIDPVTHRPRPDLRLLAGLPNMLAMAAAASLDDAVRLQVDAAQLAKLQLVQTLVQVLASGNNNPNPIIATSNGPMPINPSISSLLPKNTQFNHSLPCQNSLGLIQVPNQTTTPISLTNNLAYTNPHINQQSFDLASVLAFDGSSPIANSTPSLVSASPEDIFVDQMKEPQDFNMYISTTPLMNTAASEGLDLEDLKSDFLWKDIIDHLFSPTSPPSSTSEDY